VYKPTRNVNCFNVLSLDLSARFNKIFLLNALAFLHRYSLSDLPVEMLVVGFSLTSGRLQPRHRRTCSPVSLVHLQLSIIRLSRDVQQTAHLRGFLVVSCLARSIARASSIPASKGRGLMSIPIKTLYDLESFCLGVFAMCNKVIVFLNLRGMK
jgi:hypothetical protein